MGMTTTPSTGSSGGKSMGGQPNSPQAGFGFNPRTGDAFGTGQNQFGNQPPALNPQAGFGLGPGIGMGGGANPGAGFGFNPNTGDAFGVQSGGGQNQFAPALGGPQAGSGFGFNPNTGDAFGVQLGVNPQPVGGPAPLPSQGMGGSMQPPTRNYGQEYDNYLKQYQANRAPIDAAGGARQDAYNQWLKSTYGLGDNYLSGDLYGAVLGDRYRNEQDATKRLAMMQEGDAIINRQQQDFYNQYDKTNPYYKTEYDKMAQTGQFGPQGLADWAKQQGIDTGLNSEFTKSFDPYNNLNSPYWRQGIDWDTGIAYGQNGEISAGGRIVKPDGNGAMIDVKTGERVYNAGNPVSIGRTNYDWKTLQPGQAAPLPTFGMGGGKGIGGMLPGVIGGQVPQLPGGAQLPGLPPQGPQLVGGPAGRPIMNQPAPVNRFAPPNAPGVRPAAAVSTANQARPGAVTPNRYTRKRVR